MYSSVAIQAVACLLLGLLDPDPLGSDLFSAAIDVAMSAFNLL